ncbi:DUF1707 SHOCT-like domain-containing protein [Gordonia bronchialis]|uniref:DUF1707 SHOCT-like domain-containing protein n=1 Tax=Gordonia bronchialis TaxID=2054 RepID=UPI00242A4624|nr:DUF1707 domain-containing protein [Gordonia bronchialis]
MPDTIAQHSDSPSPRRRASTHDREATAAILRVAMTDGMLTVTEFDERSAAAYAAAYRDELAALTADVDHAGAQSHRRHGQSRDTLHRLRAALVTRVMTVLLLANRHRVAAAAISTLCVLLLFGLAAVAIVDHGDHLEFVGNHDHDHDQSRE